MNQDNAKRAMDLLEKLAGKAGQTAEQAFQYAVRAEFYQGLGLYVLGVLIFIVGGFCLGSVFRYLGKTEPADREFDELGPRLIFFVLFSLVGAALIVNNMASVFAPEGALIRALFRVQ